MAIRTQHQVTATENTWFIAFTYYNWLPLFELTGSYDLIYNWLKLADDKYGIKTNAFVIMPNHVHLLLHLTRQQVNLNTIAGNAKRFMAYEIVKRLNQQQNSDMPKTLSLACTEKEQAKGQLHKVFQPSFDARSVYTLEFLYQKLDYIHHNLQRSPLDRLAANGICVMNIQITSTATPRFTNQGKHIRLFKLRITGNIGSERHSVPQGPMRETLRDGIAGIELV